MNRMLLSVRDLAAGYGDEPITRGINFDVETGTITTIVGSNGAGKSTLLKAIYGLNRRFTGTIVFDGRNIEALAPVARFRLGLGFVPQGRCNFPLMSVRENLRLGGYSLSSAAREASIDRVTQIFPILRQRMNVMAGNLSGGEQQLLEMAMVLMISPKLLLLDEPSIGLSPINLALVLENIQGIRKRGVTVIMVEQNVRGALAISTHAVVMDLGEIIQAGSADAIMRDDKIAAAYLGQRATNAAANRL